MRTANLPNLISLARLLMAPVMVWLIIVGEMAGAFWLLVLAGVSDAVDGILARWLKARSLVGSYLDPIADKALLMGAFIALGIRGELPAWIVIMVVSRDVFIVGGVVLVHTLKPNASRVAPSPISKLNTLCQIVLAALVLAAGGFALRIETVIVALTWLVAVTTVWSGTGYLVQAGRRLSGLEETP